MNTGFRVSTRAGGNSDDTPDFSVATWCAEQMVRLGMAFNARFALLADTPGIRRSRLETGERIRSFVAGPHAIENIAVLHTARGAVKALRGSL